jgi:seryl-tRNA synthetase
MKDEIKKATELAENELQDKRIQNFKKIIKSLLETKVAKEKERSELDEEIKLIKQEIDDFKAGRLDKIKERHDIVKKADEVCPIKVVIIKDEFHVNYPFQPWRWNYQITPFTPQPEPVNYISSVTMSNSSYLPQGGITLAGNGFGVATSGTYALSNQSGAISL